MTVSRKSILRWGLSCPSATVITKIVISISSLLVYTNKIILDASALFRAESDISKQGTVWLAAKLHCL